MSRVCCSVRPHMHSRISHFGLETWNWNFHSSVISARRFLCKYWTPSMRKMIKLKLQSWKNSWAEMWRQSNGWEKTTLRENFDVNISDENVEKSACRWWNMQKEWAWMRKHIYIPFYTVHIESTHIAYNESQIKTKIYLFIGKHNKFVQPNCTLLTLY